MQNREVFLYPLLLPLFLLGGCGGPQTVESRKAFADTIAAKSHFQSALYHTPTFTLQAYTRLKNPAEAHIAVYIEGDGLSFVRRRPSRNPTPRDPVALRLAIKDPRANVVYLARPCQYVRDLKYCRQEVWTGGRFHPDVIKAYQKVLNDLKEQVPESRFTLVGYSGGGAIVTLLAAERQDVDRLITVAGTLDHKTWTAHHRVSPMTDSLNPIEAAPHLKNVRQTHFVGAMDTIMPPKIAHGFQSALGEGSVSKVVLVSEQDHHHGWDHRWPQLLKD